VIQRHLEGGAIRLGASDEIKPQIKPRACPKCGAAGLVRAEGCDKCLECGHSKCS
jgi:ribonucleoside-diphosphate reductase alpha chain